MAPSFLNNNSEPDTPPIRIDDILAAGVTFGEPGLAI